MAIADGIGGNPGGSAASNASINAVRSSVERDAAVSMEAVFEQAHGALRDLAEKEPTLRKMGTTLTVVRVKDHAAAIGHVGDTRLYHLRAEGIVTRTRDQTEAQHLVEEGILTRRSARRYPRRNVLLSSLSPDRPYDLLISQPGVAVGDRFVLLSDGVYSILGRREIRDLSLETKSAVELSQRIEATIIDRGLIDDSSAIVFATHF
jgi:protein phosphatase